MFMKKFLAITLAVGMVFCFTACSSNSGNNVDSTQQDQVENQGTTEDMNDTDVVVDTEDNTSAEDNSEASDDLQVDEDVDNSSDVDATDTVGSILKADFIKIVAEDSSLSTDEIAAKLVDNPVLTVMAGTMPIEEGLLNGFGNAEIKGFDQGTQFAPMIGTIPFVGYIFHVDDDTDVDEFISVLKANGDKAWNICTRADELVVENVDQTVFFVMCPAHFEE